MTEQIWIAEHYGDAWPVWFGPDGIRESAHWRIPIDIRQELVEWAAEFNGNFDPVQGWADVDLYAAHVEAGALIAERLQVHFGIEATVRYRPSTLSTGTSHAAMRAAAQRVRLMDGYTRWPVWVGLDGPGERPEWNLPPDVRNALSAWGTEFLEHFDEVQGWDDENTHRSHRENGEALATLLQIYVGNDMTVELFTLPLE